MSWKKIETDGVPDSDRWVAVARMDYGYCEWISRGRYRENLKWGIKATVDLSLNNSKPTHWMEVPNDE